MRTPLEIGGLPNQAVKIRECPTALHPLDGRPVAIVQWTNSFRDTFERSIAKDRHNKHLRRKAYSPIAGESRKSVLCVCDGRDGR